MLMYMFILNWMFSMIFIFLNHPLSLGCILLLQTILISLLTSYFYINLWFGYTLFLVMIGGMLVMFIYMTSVASNEKFYMSKYSILTMLFIIFITLMILFMDKFYSNMSNFLLISNNQNIDIKNMTMNKFFNYPNMQMMILLMIYLLMSLIAIVKITGKNFGSLRQL